MFICLLYMSRSGAQQAQLPRSQAGVGLVWFRARQGGLAGSQAHGRVSCRSPQMQVTGQSCLQGAF